MRKGGCQDSPFKGEGQEEACSNSFFLAFEGSFTESELTKQAFLKNFRVGTLEHLESLSDSIHTSVHIYFLSLKEGLSDKIINQALISFTEQNATDLPHSSLSLVRLDTNGTRYFLEDILEGQSHFGGELTDNIYSFNITKFVQNLVQDEYEANRLILVPTGESVNANRTEINQNIELNIIYKEF